MTGIEGAAVVSSRLPEPFSDLEPFAREWALPTEQDRGRKLASSDMPAISAFHDAMLPRMDEIFEYLNRYPLDDMPDDAMRLLFLAFSLAEVAPAVHFYKEPAPNDVFDPERFKRHDIPNMTPEF